MRVGIVTVPLPPVVSGWKGWVCVSWWNSAHQVRRVAGSAPSSGSVAEPLNVSVSPAWKVVPSAGLAMRAAGGWLTPAGGWLTPPDISPDEPPPHAANSAKAHPVNNALITVGSLLEAGSSIASAHYLCAFLHIDLFVSTNHLLFGTVAAAGPPTTYAYLARSNVAFSGISGLFV